MNVTNKTTRTFDVLGITEKEAQDLLNVAIMAEDDDAISKSAQQTCSKLKKALLDSGITRGEPNAS